MEKKKKLQGKKGIACTDIWRVTPILRRFLPFYLFIILLIDAERPAFIARLERKRKVYPLSL